MQSALSSKIERRSGAYNVLSNLAEDLAQPLSIQDAMKLKRVYQNEITKLIKAGDA